MDRLGVTFNRTPEGFLDRRRFGGTLYKRTAFAGATTGQQLLYALDEQVRRWESEGMVRKFEFWDFLGPITDDSGRCVGAIAQDMVSMQIRAFPGAATVVATGGCGLIYGRSTMSVFCNGGAVSRCFQAGAKYGNAEFIQVHPTAIPGADKLRLMSESARGEGGRVWVPRRPQDSRPATSIPESERYYFLEERYPKYGNLVPRDIATREIFNICVNEGLSVEAGRMCVYLDLTHIERSELDRKLGGILEIYEKFQGVDPRDVPMKMGRLRQEWRWRTIGRGSAQPDDQHRRAVCHRRMRLPIPRGKSSRSKFVAELHIQRPFYRTLHQKPDSRSRNVRSRLAVQYL
jgi:succinate dehydrogenase / fumarate reductase flavoprotein subunit